MADTFKITGVWKNDGDYHYVDDSGNPRSGSMNPPEHLAAAVVSCIGKTMHMVMGRMKIDHAGFTVTGIAHKADDEPTRIGKVTLDATIQGAQLSELQKNRLVELTEKYCLVSQTLQRGAEIGFSIDS